MSVSETHQGLAETRPARAAWEAIHFLLKGGPAPPPVYQGQYDPKALFAALKVFVCQ